MVSSVAKKSVIAFRVNSGHLCEGHFIGLLSDTEKERKSLPFQGNLLLLCKRSHGVYALPSA